jgi:hypothetical protein
MLSGCKAGSSNNASAAGKTYDVAPGFREFYSSLGGEALLGSAISQKFVNQEYECQYTVNALMCLNPVISGSERFRLFPLGDALNVREEPGEIPGGSNANLINGYAIYEEFIPLYDQLSGPKYAGNPLTQVRLNYAQQRVEQYFENVGFYRKFSDPPGTIKLLAYGVAACEEHCDYRPLLEAMVVDPTQNVTDQPFLDELGKVGDSSVFGKPLTQPYIAADGLEEQVYESVVVYADTNGKSVRLRPIPILLGLLIMDPGPKIYSNQNGVVFYTVRGNLGYHVPIVFDDFINAHGGTSLSGDPIAEVIEVQSGIYRQCFENYCLDYSPAVPEAQRVTLAPLGKLFLDQLQSTTIQQQPEELSPETVNVKLVEHYSQLPAGEPQRITLFLTRKSNQQPLIGIESDLKLTLPDGSIIEFALPATQPDGSASVLLPVIKNIPNGSILTYQVCLRTASIEPICA